MTSQIRSTLADKATAAFAATPWWPHATLLHGSVYGVPLRALDPVLAVDNRPSADGVRVALGSHDDDVIGALAVGGFATSTDEARRDTERLLGAFTGQLLREIGSPDGAVAVEEHEHDIAFGSLPGGIRGDDRFLAGQSGAPLTIGRAGRAAASRQAAGLGLQVQEQAEVRLSKLFLDRRALITGADVDAVVGAAGGAADPPASTEPRLVPRPAPRFHFPLDPMVAVQGASRSLRHGHDGRASPDGLLWCRWAAPDGARAEGPPLRRDRAADAGQRRGPRRGAVPRPGGGPALALPAGLARRRRRRRQRPGPRPRSEPGSTPRPPCASAPTRSTTGPPRRWPARRPGGSRRPTSPTSCSATRCSSGPSRHRSASPHGPSRGCRRGSSGRRSST